MKTAYSLKMTRLLETFKIVIDTFFTEKPILVYGLNIYQITEIKQLIVVAKRERLSSKFCIKVIT